ncbi:hypothetical protein GGI25_002085 [Coemansia spiralis]|uniref:Homeobox domain-containing protein n=2 Tax=Coemansia TaxID=4863 RepID=A0A9W8KZC1_9FUNG|nr:hypothetical protein EDC05_005035 [Coemansia umbellata]KAJ2619949.1 hypothetical protein GGI26_005402 [Coemansia sp. RSA 1358]KAJ2678701.1 hypothetical protein GGI25_002085 [Coemansia spiralis]
MDSSNQHISSGSATSSHFRPHDNACTSVDAGCSPNSMANHSSFGANGNILPRRYTQIVIKEPSTAEPKKAKRKRITPEQLKELTTVFEKTDTPTHDIREELSKKLNMTNREVQVWFQNRRAKYNRLRIEQQRQLRTNAAIIYSAGMINRAPVSIPVSIATMPAPASISAPPLHSSPATYSHLHQYAHPHVHNQVHGHPIQLPPKSLESTNTPVSPGIPLNQQSSFLSSAITDTHGDYYNAMHPPNQTAASLESRRTFDEIHTSMHRAKSIASASNIPAQHPGTYTLGHTSARTASSHNYQYQYQQQQNCQSQSTVLPESVGLSAELVHCSLTDSSTESNHPYQHYPDTDSSDNIHRRHSQQHSGFQHPLNRQGSSNRCASNGRRNTVSAYQNIGALLENGFKDSEVQPLQRCPTAASSIAVHTKVTDVRARYMPNTPADTPYSHRRYNVVRRSRSPAQNDCYNSGSLHISKADLVQTLPAVADTAATPIKHENAASDTSGRAIKLPSFRTILANVECKNNNGTSTGTAAHPVSSLESQPQHNMRRLSTPTSNTLPSETMLLSPVYKGEGYDEAQFHLQKTAMPHSSYPQQQLEIDSPNQIHFRDCYSERPQCYEHYSQPGYAQCTSSHTYQRYAESQINDAKMGIDVLATAAISVSSAKSSSSLPHLTPLSEFSYRTAPNQYSQSATTLVQQQSDHHSLLPNSNGPELEVVRSRKVTPTEGIGKIPRSWRPW